MFCGVINVLFAGAALLVPFRPGEVTVGGEVGHRMPVEFRETALGGLAATPTGRAVKKRMHKPQ